MPAETLASRLTPAMPAGIATISVRGPGAVAKVVAASGWQVREPQPNRVYYALWPVDLSADPLASGQYVKEQVVLCLRHSESIDIHCHGGHAVCRAILNSLAHSGCRIVNTEDWCSELGCPIARQAEHALPLARTDKAAALILAQMNGSLRGEIEQIISLLEAKPSDVRPAWEALRHLISTYDFGQHLVTGWSIVLAGPPNVGKSSLINAIAGQSRSIVHAMAGTTRDWLEAETAIDGWPVTLTDTAGIRESAEALEREGITRALERIRTADLLILVVDASIGWTATHEEIAAAATAPKLICVNKFDLLQGSSEWQSLAENDDTNFDINALTSQRLEQFGIPLTFADRVVATAVSPNDIASPDTDSQTSLTALLERVRQTLFCDPPAGNAAVVFARAHVAELIGCLTELNLQRTHNAIAKLRRLLQA
jgi:tRNA modification GTPase